MRGVLANQRPFLGVLATIAAVTATTVSCSTAGGDWPGHTGPPPLYTFDASSDFGMVSTGSVEATQAGVQVLERGGNAVDAAVAAAFALGVSDPGGSGLGGATYMLIVPSVGEPVAIDGSTPAPLAADPSVLLAIRQSEKKKYFGYKAISVPTTAATLGHALGRYGTMSLAEVLEPAIGIAKDGFLLNANSVSWARGYLDEILASRYFRFVLLENGDQLGEPGRRLCRPDLQRTLEHLARDGVTTFYRGPMAAEIVADIQANGGFVGPGDLALYRARELRPLRSSYRDAELLTFPLPGGGPEVVEALNILQQFPAANLARPTVERLHLLVEAARIAHIDHTSHVLAGEAGGGALPGGYLTEGHARERAALIQPGRAVPDSLLSPGGPMPDFGDHTTHVSVIDRDGTMVSLTQTLCRVYGGKIATPGLGFPYNCCLEFLDFEHPENPFYLRPRGTYPSAMAPTILRRGTSVTVLGGAGSDRIPSTLIEVISNLVDRGLSLKEAVVAPRVMWNSASNPPRVCLEIAGPITDRDGDRLQSFGFEHMFRLHYPPAANTNLGFFGGVNAVSYDATTGIFSGVGDPRRNGFALGPRVVAQPSERQP